MNYFAVIQCEYFDWEIYVKHTLLFRLLLFKMGGVDNFLDTIGDEMGIRAGTLSFRVCIACPSNLTSEFKNNYSTLKFQIQTTLLSNKTLVRFYSNDFTHRYFC